MALTYGFYNSLNSDRKYDAEQFGDIFNGVINDGVFVNIGEHFAVTPLSGMSVKVGTGRAWFNGTWTKNDAQIPLTISTADISLTRIDAVVLEVNHSVTVRANSIKIVKGSPASTPSKPTLTNDSSTGVYQHALAYITVNAGTTSISSIDIEIVVGKEECPYITSILQTTSVDELYNQWDAQFTSWFENLQTQMSDNVVTNLQHQIDRNTNNITNLNNNKLAVSALATTADAQVAMRDDRWMSPFKVSQYLDVKLATTAEAQAGTSDSKWMSPLKVKQAIDSFVGIPTKMDCGSYIGTGGYGFSYMCNITVNFSPRLVFVWSGGDRNSGCTVTLVHLSTRAYVDSPSLPISINGVYWMYNGVSWHADGTHPADLGPIYQLNVANVRYYWVAIGVNW